MPANRQRIGIVLKWMLALAILVLVARQFVLILQRDDFRKYPLHVEWEWLIPCGLLYLAAHTCWGTFWVRLVRSQGPQVGFGVGLRAYFVSQFGKYIPGKVAVIAMRMEMLAPLGCRRLVLAVTATFETLLSMSVGALLAILFLPKLGALPTEVSQNVVWIVVLASLPLGMVGVYVVLRWVVGRSRGPDATPLPFPPLVLLAQGLLHDLCGWCLLGLSLACTIRALTPQPLDWTWPGYLGDLAAIALAYVAGFVVPTPGGLGGREFVLQIALGLRFEQMLAMPPDEAMGLSVVAALVLRLTWTVAEVMVGVPLYWWKPRDAFARGADAAPLASD